MISTNYLDRCDAITQGINAMNNTAINGECDGVYVGTNEYDREVTFECLANATAIPQSCHIGFSSWFNFDIIIARKSSRAILIDFNPNTKTFLVETLNQVVTSENRTDFADKIREYIRLNESKFALNCNVQEYDYSHCTFPYEEVQCELNIPGNWLNTDEGFDYIKKLANEGKIAVITEDISSHEALEKISRVVKENKYVIDTLYVANISQYFKGNEECFVNSIHLLSCDETKIVHCPDSLVQKVIEGKNVSRELLF